MKKALVRIAAWLSFPVLVLLSMVTLLADNKPDVATLVKRRSIFIALSVACAVCVVLFIAFAELTGSTWLFMVLASASCGLFLYCMFQYLSCTGKASAQIAHLLFHQWDPEQFDSEYPPFTQLFSKAERDGSLLRYFLAIANMNRGEFEQAGRCFGKTAPVSPLLAVDQGVAETICLIRTGRLAEAEQPCANCQTLILQHPEIQTYCNEHHLVGLFALENGERNKAMWYFRKALEMPAVPFVVSAVLYDYARLMEQEGLSDEAIKQYQAAALLCPKTWLGQEATQRAEALQHMQKNHANEKALPG